MKVLAMMGQGGGRRLLLGMILGVSLSLFPVLCIRLVDYAPLPRIFTPIVRMGEFVSFLLVLFLIPNAAILSILGAVSAMRASRATLVFLPALVFFGIPFVAFPYAPAAFYDKGLRQGVARAVDRGAPVIAAIEAFAKAHGQYPESLDQLVPEYLKALPYTGMVGHPEYTYSRPGPDDDFTGYRLRVSMAWLMDFDDLTYLPPGNKPYAPSKALTRYGEWVFFDD